MFCLQAKFMSLRSQLVERSLENHLQLYTIVIDYPILLYDLILCLFFLVLMCLGTTLYMVSRLRCNWCRPLGGPRTFWSGPNAGQVEIPENSPEDQRPAKYFWCYGEVRDNIGNIRVCGSDRNHCFEKKWIVVMTNVCTMLYSNEKDCVISGCTSVGSHQLPSSELEEEEEREKLFKLIDTWNDLVHQGGVPDLRVWHPRISITTGSSASLRLTRFPRKCGDLMEKKHTFVGGGVQIFKSVTSFGVVATFPKARRAENWSLVSGKLYNHMGVPKVGGTQQPWGFLIKMIILACFGGYHHLRKHPYIIMNHFPCHLHQALPEVMGCVALFNEAWTGTWAAAVIMTWLFPHGSLVCCKASLVFQNNYHTWCITRFHHDLALSKTHPLKFLYSKCKCVALVFYQNSSHNGHQQHLPCLTNEAKPAIIRAFLAATGRSLAIHQSQPTSWICGLGAI